MSSDQSSSPESPEVTTLPSLPKEGKVKSRRKPSFRLNGQVHLQTEHNNVTALLSDDNGKKATVVKKDGARESTGAPSKKGPRKSSHGKKEIRTEEDEDNHPEIMKKLNSSINVTHEGHGVSRKENYGTSMTPSDGSSSPITKEKKTKTDSTTKDPIKVTTETPIFKHQDFGEVSVVDVSANK